MPFYDYAINAATSTASQLIADQVSAPISSYLASAALTAVLGPSAGPASIYIADILAEATPAAAALLEPVVNYTASTGANSVLNALAEPFIPGSPPRSALSPSSSSSPSFHLARSGMPSSANTLEPPTIAAIPLASNGPAPPTPNGHLGGGVLTLPFSFPVWTEAKVTANAAWTINNNNLLKDFLRPYRYAKLNHLEAVVLPRSTANVPFEVNLTWTDNTEPDITTATASLNHIATTRYVYRDNVLSHAPGVTPAPLGGINPIIKDSVAYVDTPKLHMVVFVDGDPDTIKFDLLIRGSVQVAHPAIY